MYRIYLKVLPQIHFPYDTIQSGLNTSRIENRRKNSEINYMFRSVYVTFKWTNKIVY